MQKPIDLFATDDDDRQRGIGQRAPRFEFANGATPLTGYTIKRGVGVGGFGEVYYAVADAGKDVAIKRIQRNLDIELRGVRQCLNLKHPNLIALYDIRYDDNENPWVVMEYVAGESLQEVIDRNPNGLPIDQVDRWFAGLAAGIGYLHDCGVVHRDIKPANLFLDEGTVKIGDYGLSKFISCSRRSGQTQSVGTFHYMAPEIGQGRYGKEIDIYALGIVLYEMLIGHVPFEGESSQEIIMKHLTSAPPLGDLPARYQPVIAGALKKDPDQRTHEVVQMCRQLQLPGTPLGPSGEFRTGFEDAHDEVILAEAVDEMGDPYGPTAAESPKTPPLRPFAVPEEPVARALYLAAQNIRRSWHQLSWSAPFKLVIVLLAVYSLTRVGPKFVPFLFTVCGAYGIYYLVRSLILVEGTRPEEPAEARVLRTASEWAASVDQRKHADASTMAASHRARDRHRSAAHAALKKDEKLQRARQEIANKPLRQRLAELSGAFVLAAFASIIASFAIQLFDTQDLRAPYLEWAPVGVWMACVTTLTAWTILSAAKFWESSSEGVGLRRFMLLVAGVGIGAIAWSLSQWLMVAPSYLTDPPRFGIDFLPNEFYGASGMPQWGAYLAFFGGMMAIPLWWKQADPLRGKRISLWTIGITMLLILGYQIVCPFPRGVLLAGVVAFAVQVAAPWLSPRKRTH